MLESGDGPQEFQLNIFRKGRGQPLQVKFFGVKAAGLDKDLVSQLLREADDLIFNRRAVPGTDALDLAAVEGRAFQIGKDDLLRLFARIRNITDRLVLRREGEVVREADQFSSPYWTSSLSRSTDRALTREGVPVLKRRVWTPSRCREPGSSVAGKRPSGPEAYDTSPT